MACLERPSFCSRLLLRLQRRGHLGPQLLLLLADLAVHVGLQVLALLVDVGEPALDRVDLLVLFQDLAVGLSAHRLDELAFRGDGAHGAAHDLRLSPLEKEVERRASDGQGRDSRGDDQHGEEHAALVRLHDEVFGRRGDPVLRHDVLDVLQDVLLVFLGNARLRDRIVCRSSLCFGSPLPICSS